MTVSESSPASIDTSLPPLSAPLKLSFDYTRSVGPVLGQFFKALRDRRIVGVRGSDGRVHVQWAAEPAGAITDIAYFALGEAAESVPDATDDRDPVTMVVIPTAIEIQHTASLPESAYLRALHEGKLLGAHTGQDGKVYFPAREADPATGLQLNEFLELPDKGTVTTFAIINIPFAGQRIKPPYVAAYVLLDGADIAFLHLVTEIDASEVRMGMRVEAVWKPREEWDLGIDNIDHFRPTGEPDADYDSYKHHL